MDRFLMKLSMGLPDREEEIRILDTYMNGDPMTELEAVITKEELLAMKKEAALVYVHKAVEGYMVDLVAATRSSSKTVMGVSPRGTLALLRGAKAWAWIHDRSYVVPDDVKAVAPAILAHRLVLSYGQSHYREAVRLMEEICDTVTAPTEDFSAR